MKVSSKQGVVVNLGRHEDVIEVDIRDDVQSLIADSDKRSIVSLKGKMMVDRNGVRRLFQEILDIF